MADEEPVDPKKYLEETCKPKCVKPLLEYEVWAYNRKPLFQSSHHAKILKGRNVSKLSLLVPVGHDSRMESEACVKRIKGDESGHKHCTGQYFDYWSCVDKCVAPKLFTKLK